MGFYLIYYSFLNTFMKSRDLVEVWLLGISLDAGSVGWSWFAASPCILGANLTNQPSSPAQVFPHLLSYSSVCETSIFGLLLLPFPVM
jgi:hypothetical protein